jgi:hypothetical protein
MKKSLSLLLMLLALGAGGHTYAAEPVPVAAANLGFDKWDNGAPAGWNARPTGYTASSDCDAGRGARCVLRLSSTDAYTRGSFFPVAQRIALGAAAGRQLTLSGMIRTENVDGIGALWARADSPAAQQSLAFDNMAKRAPETAWIFSPIVMRSWGQNPVTLTPALGYDGVLYIDAVTPPEYR